MKKLLITGAHSYIGTAVGDYLSRWPDRYEVTKVSVSDGSWRNLSFQGFDAVLHTAAIVHQPGSKQDPSQWPAYEAVNTTLAIQVGEKAKEAGVGQFIFLSSASVYGLDAPLGKPVTITADTPLSPKDHYGRSKLKAEEGLRALAGDGFRIAVLRPPMIYGKGCKGNYQKLAAMAKKLPVFPAVENKRSMLYIGNLTEFIRLILDDQAEGTFCPQDGEYVSTCDMVNLIAHCHGKSILMVKGVTWALKLLRPFTPAVDKAFGSLCYARELSAYPKNYQVVSLADAILETETDQ